MKGLFFWPCLLFRLGVSQIWTETGYTNMRQFLSDCKKHEKASAHLEAYKIRTTFNATVGGHFIFTSKERRGGAPQ